MRLRGPVALISCLVLVLTACGGDAGPEETQDIAPTTDAAGEPAAASTTGPTAEQETPAEGDALAQAEEAADAAAEALEAQQEAEGGGSAMLTIGDATWSFDSVLCAFGPDEIGQDDAEFVLSAIQDGLQLYVSIDGFGHSVSIDDIEDFENPSVSMTADATAASLNGAPEFLVELDGKNATARGFFIDYSTDEMESREGTLEATCP